jgi:ABC-type sugar transport system permease subunit
MPFVAMRELDARSADGRARLALLWAWWLCYMVAPLVVVSVAIASMWMGIGTPFLLFLAGLQSVPVELYEAASLDGANNRQLFWHITLPFLVPVATILSVLTILGAMQIFNLVMAMTNGGPGSATEVLNHPSSVSWDAVAFTPWPMNSESIKVTMP